MIVIDYRDKRPLYEQVTEKIAHLIICGALESNAKLPSVRSLAMDLSVNPNTIQRAYAQLEQDGYIYTVVGRGNYVTDSQEWRKGRLKEITCELEEAMQHAKDAGLTKSEVLAIADRIFEGNSQTPAGAESNFSEKVGSAGAENSSGANSSAGKADGISERKKEDSSND